MKTLIKMIWLIMVAMLYSFTNANAATTIIPMDMSNWTYIGSGSSGGMTQTVDGITFTGSGYREWGGIASNLTDNLTNVTIYTKWLANGGTNGEYMATGSSTTNSPTVSGLGVPYTTDHSFNGSLLIPQNTWLYSRNVIHPDMTWEFITSLNNYDTQGGSVLYDTSYTWSLSSQEWNDVVGNGGIWVSLGDNYGGTSAFVTVNEVKYENNAALSTPIPGALFMFLPSVLGLFGYTSRKKKPATALSNTTYV